MNEAEQKKEIMDYFVESSVDRFTKTKRIISKHSKVWNSGELEDKIKLPYDGYPDSLGISYEYRFQNEIDGVFLTVEFVNTDGGYVGLDHVEIYLIIDGENTIKLSQVIDYNYDSNIVKIYDVYINKYNEKVLVGVEKEEFLLIANSSTIEYSIRFGNGLIEGLFNDFDIANLCGFYNSVFDNEFKFEFLSSYCSIEDANTEAVNPSEEGLGTLELSDLSLGSVNTLINKYNINENDLKKLQEIEISKSQLGFFSFKKEKLKAESLRILKPYNVKFLDLGVLLEEIKNLS